MGMNAALRSRRAAVAARRLTTDARCGTVRQPVHAVSGTTVSAISALQRPRPCTLDHCPIGERATGKTPGVRGHFADRRIRVGATPCRGLLHGQDQRQNPLDLSMGRLNSENGPALGVKHTDGQATPVGDEDVPTPAVDGQCVG
jgi:hypothetical protein